jgi:hypothetical protein
VHNQSRPSTFFKGGVSNCFVAQRKRVWLITRRPKDQNLPKQNLVLAQLVERSTVVGNKHRTAAGSIPASQKHTSSGSVTVA